MRYNISVRRQQSFATVTATCAVATLRVDNVPAKDAKIEDVTPYLGEKSAELVVNDETKKYAIQHNTKSGHTWIRVCSNIDEILEGTRAIDVTSNDPLGDETTMSDCLGMGLEMIIQGDNRLEEFNNKIVKPLLEVLERCSEDFGHGGKQKQGRECLKLALINTQSFNYEIVEPLRDVLEICSKDLCNEEEQKQARECLRKLNPNITGALNNQTVKPLREVLKNCSEDQGIWEKHKQAREYLRKRAQNITLEFNNEIVEPLREVLEIFSEDQGIWEKHKQAREYLRKRAQNITLAFNRQIVESLREVLERFSEDPGNKEKQEQARECARKLASNITLVFNNQIVEPLREVLGRFSEDQGIWEKHKQALECVRKLALYRTDPANVEAKLAEAIECVKSYLQQCESTSHDENVDSWEWRAFEVFSEMPLGNRGCTAHLADRISTFCKFEASKACSLVAPCADQIQSCGQSRPPKDFAVRKTNEHLLSESQIDYSQYYNGAPRILNLNHSGTNPIYLANTMWYQEVCPYVGNGGLFGGRYFEMALVTLFSNPKDYEMARQIWKTLKVPFDPEVYHHQDKIRPALNWLVKVDGASSDNQEMKKAWKDAVVDMCRQKLINGYLSKLLTDQLCRESPTDGAQIIERHKHLLSTTLDQSDENIPKKHAEWVNTGRAIIESQNGSEINKFVEQSALKDVWDKIKWSDEGPKTEFKGLLTSYGQRLGGWLSAAELLDLGYQALEIKLKSLVLTHWIDSIDAAVTGNLQSVDPWVLSQVDSEKEVLITPLLEEILGFEGL